MVRIPRSIAELPQPPGPFRREFWRSPIRGPWLTAVFGLVLLVGITVMVLTGLASYAAYNPTLGHNDLTPTHGILGFFLFSWPTRPSWLYWLTQGIHVTLGLVLVPVLLGKLWSVIPKLFDWPPVATPAQAIERVSLLLLVGGAVFEFVTGILNVQYWYVFPGSFYTLHLYGAWVFIAAFIAHVAVKYPKMRAALKRRRIRDELRVDLEHTEPEPPDEDNLVSPAPGRPSISRRGALGLVGASSLTLFLMTAGQSIAGPFRRVSVLAPRSQDPGSGPNGFQINKTAQGVGIKPAETGASWRLRVAGARGRAPLLLTRDELKALPQHTAHLPIACVEGWSTGNQRWTGVRLRDLAAMAGVPSPATLDVESLQPHGEFRAVTLRGNQVGNGDSLLALQVNGADLSPDHGFPARIIVPANPGVHNTKWVARLTFNPHA
jgi:DMSO/TMAO reductase YedYZ molybdopterin-dependent catalytic subunit